MKYVPRSAPEGINVSPEHPLAEAATLIVGLGLIIAIAALILFFLVDLVVLLVPASTEARIFSTYAPRELQPGVLDEPRADATTALVRRLAAHWPDNPYRFRVGVMDSEVPNALAAPGGLIVVTTGLLDRVKSENELAFVLAHELGHYRNRDHIKTLGRGIASGIFLATLGLRDSGAALGLSVTDLALKGFGREQERRADAFALELVHAEYGHVADSGKFFERLEREPLLGNELWIYFSTHPSPATRIADLGAMASQAGWPLTGPVTSLAWSAPGATAH